MRPHFALPRATIKSDEFHFSVKFKHFLMCLNETSTKVEISSLSFNSLVFTIDFSENMPYSITPVVLSSLFLQFNSPENESASRVFDLKNGLVSKDHSKMFSYQNEFHSGQRE